MAAEDKAAEDEAPQVQFVSKESQSKHQSFAALQKLVQTAATDG